ncbi:histidine kinase [Winogradskyella sp. 3972H.M.0a.05]|uniref:sensor histidine kinase n=1 Tax=Winogradskyella sp. 3972H.M.0a.05 TaxID=2950277 RepID=UPI003390E1B1
MRKIVVYHILLWLFIFGMILDSMLFDYEWKEAILYSLVECGLNAFIAYANLFFFIPKFFERKGKLIYIVSIAVFFALLFVPYYFSGLGYYLLDTLPHRVVFSFTVNFIILILISFLFWKVNQYELEKKRSLALSNQKLKTELLLLKSQVSPHFLFNTLNNIYSLSLEKHDHAPIMIEKLSEILRYLIYDGKREVVPLEKETNLVKEYIDLQLLKKMKGEEQIKLTIDVVEQYHEIAPLILVNLVENCFKHGDINYNPDGFIDINLTIKDDVLYFKTKNSFQESNTDEGIGIANIQEQLKYSYPDAHQFNIDKGLKVFEVSLTINLL